MADATANASSSTRPATSSRFFLRVGLFFAGWTAVHLGLVAILAHAATPGGWWPYVALFVMTLGATWLILRSFREDAHPGLLHRLFVARPFFYVQMGLPVLSVTGLLAFLVGLPFARGLAWATVALAFAALMMLALYVAGYFGSKVLVVKRLTFAYPDLPAAFDGLVIAQLSDMHVGPQTSSRFMRRVVRIVEDAKPDLIAHTGDQVDDYHEDTARFTAAFGGLCAPLGTFAIAGNHDIYAGWPQVREGLQSAGIHVLVNDAVTLQRGEDTLWLAGTGDPAALRSMGEPVPEAAPDIARTMAKIPGDAFSIVLAHNPALWPMLVERGAHLTLSGHTHHGQLSIPFLRWSLANPFLELAMGTYERGRSKLYINPGTNHWGLPFRLGAWPEVTLVTLRRAS